ncbi:MAG: hypothetical protein JXR58_07420 [Bacteroidales bacterium]|nr:hypothetical protein [Bacteroidales bacterium]
MTKQLIISFLIISFFPVFAAETDELRIKGSYFTVGANSTVTISGSATETNVSDAGFLKIEENSTYYAEGNINNLSGSSIMVDGNLFAYSEWNNEGVSSLSHPGLATGNVEFAGTALQNIGGTVNTIFENLSINNPLGVNLTHNQTVSVNLFLVDGLVYTGANHLEFSSLSNNITGYGNDRYIAGNLRRHLSELAFFDFPVGSPTTYELVKVFVNTQTGLNYLDVNFSVSNENPVPGGLTVNGVTVDEFLDYGFWTISANPGLSAIDYNLVLFSKGHTDKGGSFDNYSLISDIGSGWQDYGIHTSADQFYSATEVRVYRNHLSQFGSFVPGYSSLSTYLPFPVSDELRIKGSIFKVQSGSETNVTNNLFTVNNSDLGILKIDENGTFASQADVNNLSGSSIQVDGNFILYSDLINNATASVAHPGPGIGTFEFSGTLLQNIAGTVSTVFENFTINNPSGVSLQLDQTITANLLFNNGLIITGANKIIFTSLTNTISGYGDGKYVFGTLRRFLDSGLDYDFPVGSASFYELSTIHVNTHTGLNFIDVNFTVNDENPVPGGLSVNGVIVDEFLDYGYWNFVPNVGLSAIEYDISIQSKGHTDKGGTFDNYSLISDIGAGWQDYGFHSSVDQFYSPTEVRVYRNHLEELGKFIIGYSSISVYYPFPVTDELRIKGSVYKVQSGSENTVCNNSFSVNNSDLGLLKIDENGIFISEGDINNLSSSSIELDGTLVAMAHWNNEATASVSHSGPGLGTVEFAGTLSQNIGGTVSTVFENITINNSAGVLLPINQTVTELLSFNDGVISTGANRLDVTSLSKDILGFGDGKYIFGNLRRYLGTGMDYNLPMGSASFFELASVNIYSQTGLNYIDVSFTISDENPVPGGLSVNGVPVDEFLDYGYWTFSPNIGATASDYSVMIQSKGHTDKGGTFDNYSLISDIGSGWQDYGTHTSADQYYSATEVRVFRNHLNDFGSYIVGFSAATIYNPYPVTDELRIKGSVYKVQSGSENIVCNSGFSVNNSNIGLLKIDAGGNFVSEGDINNLSGSSIQIDGNLAAKSNWNNEATASLAHPGPGTGTTEFSGALLQDVGGSVSTIFENFTIDNPLGVNLSNNQIVSKHLLFNNGIISTGGNRLEMTSISDDVSGYGDGKYIFGNLRRYLNAGIDYHLPIGTASNFELASIYVNNHLGLNYIDVSFTISNENPVPGGLTVEGVPVDEFLDYGYWTFSPNPGLGAVSYHAEIQSKGHTDKGGTSDNYSLISDIGSGWQDYGTHTSADQYYSPTEVNVVRNYLNQFGSYIVGFSATTIYNPYPVTDELRIKGSYYRVQSGANSTITGDAVLTNISDVGKLNVNASSDFHTEGGINNESGSTINLLGNINIEGDWINNANVNATGSILFRGNINQTIGGVNITSFGDLRINKGSGNVSLDINAIVNETLTLTDGYLITGSNKIICTSTAPSDITGYSSTSFVYGTLEKNIATNTSVYPLPVGKGASAGDYHLAEFVNNNLAGIGAIDVSVASITEGGSNVDANLDPLIAIQDGVPLENVLEDAEWTIEPLNPATGGTYGIRLYVDNIANLSSVDDFEFCILKRSGLSTDYADWDAFSATTVIPADNLGGRTYLTYDGMGIPIGSGYAQRTGYNSFSKFAIAKSRDIAFPVELLSFTGILTNGVVELNWTTVTEINNDFFTIQRAQLESEEQLRWEELIRVPGAGNSNYRIDYEEVDNNPFPGISLYRLKQTDFDGSYSFSEIVVINNIELLGGNNQIDFSVFPNPSFNETISIISIEKYNPNTILKLEILDLLGRPILRKSCTTDNSGNYSFIIDESDILSSGLYEAKVYDEQENIFKTKKIVIK